MGSLALVDILARGLNASGDPRVGSSRDNGTSTSALRVTSGTNSASFATLGMTLLPVSIYAAVCLLIFGCCRRRWPRVYAPRTFLTSLEPHERIEPLPATKITWVKAFYEIPDTEVLNNSSLDGFLFLRYLKILFVICGVGCLITWPVLLPLCRYGGNGSQQLDLFTFGNISSIHPNWYYVHAFQAWLFFGFILYMISRECVYFINLRQAYMLSPYYSDRLSSRTVLFTCVPYQILDERKLRKVFGDAAKHIWIPRETEELDDLVKDRQQAATRLEKAEILLIKKVNEAYLKALKNGHPDISTHHWSQDSETTSLKSPVKSDSGTKERETWYSKEADLSFDSATPTSPMSPQALSPQTFIDTNVNVIPAPTKGKDPVVSPEIPSFPRDFVRQDGTPGFKTSYGYNGPPPDINGSVAAQWIPYQTRPVHRPLKNYGKKVDTIKWTRTELKEVAPKIGKLRREYKKRRGRPIPAVFIEFDTQANAQSAYQTLAHHRANHMVADIIGVRPKEIIWEALKIPWWEKIIRRFAIQAFIAAMVIFWCLPAAVVGLISNVKYLTTTIKFLGWIDKLPKLVLGLISGLLPAIALSFLMAVVPFVMRACARASGVPTQAKVELFTQNAYFVFQVVQVFLVTTLTSAISGALTSIIKDPLSIRTLLSANLPNSSNFYVSYFILQGLAMSATRMAHAGSIIRHQFMANDGLSPRMMARRYHRLRVIHWGAVYPVFTNMGVIAISYALIAPIVLGVAFIGFLIIYATYRYNLLYVYSSENDARGLHYPRALKQTFTGVYLAEICMIGLFGLGNAFGPLVLMFGLVAFTALIHISLDAALSPLLYKLPRTLAVEEEFRRAGHNGLEFEEGIDELDVEEQEQNVYDDEFDPGAKPEVVHSPETTDRGLRDIQGKGAVFKLTSSGLTSYVRIKINKSPIPAFIHKIDFWTYWITPDPTVKHPWYTYPLLRWLHPEIFADYLHFRNQLPAWPPIEYDDVVLRDAFCPPSVRARAPRLWIPRDVAGVSAQECAHSGKVIRIEDEGVSILRNSMLNVDVETDRRESWEKMRY